MVASRPCDTAVKALHMVFPSVCVEKDVLAHMQWYTCAVLLQVRLASVAENSFNAVERIDEIAHIDQEDRDDIPGSRPDNWPSSGKACPCSYIPVYVHMRVFLPRTCPDMSAAYVGCGHA